MRLYTKSSTGDLRFERVAVPPVRIHRNIQEQLPGEQQLIRDNIKANEEAYKKREIAAQVIERKYGMSFEQQGLNRPALLAAVKKSRRRSSARCIDAPATYGLSTSA